MQLVVPGTLAANPPLPLLDGERVLFDGLAPLHASEVETGPEPKVVHETVWPLPTVVAVGLMASDEKPGVAPQALPFQV
tara:strand:- start:1428 stop:1664 length:237 start_codon:yes stop_codon:yes gene_type:complete